MLAPCCYPEDLQGHLSQGLKVLFCIAAAPCCMGEGWGMWNEEGLQRDSLAADIPKPSAKELYTTSAT